MLGIVCTVYNTEIWLFTTLHYSADTYRLVETRIFGKAIAGYVAVNADDLVQPSGQTHYSDPNTSRWSKMDVLIQSWGLLLEVLW